MVGGDKESHERLQEGTAKIKEEIDKRGGKVRCPEEFKEIVDKAREE